MEPPSLIHSAPVRLYAKTNGAEAWTGTLNVFVDGKLLGPMPQLAICEELLSGDFLLMFCDENWFPAGVAAGTSLDALKLKAERAYDGVAGRWQEYRQRTQAELIAIETVRKFLNEVDIEQPLPKTFL